MLMEACNIEWISPMELDELLAQGWFRGRGILFHSDIICFDGDLQSTLNVRLNVAAFVPKKRHRKLLQRNRAKYTISWGPPKLDERHNQIYHSHAKRFKDLPHETIDEAYLLSGPERQFHEYECSVYKGDQLVAFSYADVGVNAMASIMCCFDTDLEKESFGIYTMLEEIEFAKQQGIQWYYPGYVLDKSKLFDYKLSLGPVEWLLANESWQLGERSMIVRTRTDVLNVQMQKLHEMLALNGIDASWRFYPFFASGFVTTHDAMLALPTFFSWKHGEKTYAAGYDLDEGRFLFFEPVIAHEWDEYRHPNIYDELARNDRYEVHFIKTQSRIFFNSLRAFNRIIEELTSVQPR
jgi:leucyl-tRNA---protein transferase